MEQLSKSDRTKVRKYYIKKLGKSSTDSEIKELCDSVTTVREAKIEINKIASTR